MFCALLLLDPVISPASCYLPSEQPPVSLKQLAGIAGRRYEFESPEDMFGRLREKMPYKLWREDVLMDYCIHGLSAVTSSPTTNDGRCGPPDTDSRSTAPSHGKWVLACPPQCEVAMYRGAYTHYIAPRLQQVCIPVRIIRAEGLFSFNTIGSSRAPNFLHSPTDPELWRQFGTPAEDVHLPGQTHFFPQSDPQFVTAHVCEMLQRACPNGMSVARSRL